MKIVMALAVTMSSAAVVANDQLAQKYACTGCHQMERKVVGPPWKGIRDKYKDGSVTAAQLAKVIKAGSTGKWGPIPMPPQASVTDADAEALAGWILRAK